MNAPAISVLIVTRNHGDLLRVAVRSMLDQTWQDLEVLVVDNHSTDGSIEALTAAVQDPRLRLERLPENIGIADGINYGFGLCHGRFIALMDSDDVSYPRRLELQMAALAAEPALAGVSCDARLVDVGGRPIGEWRSFHTPDDIRAYAAYNMPLHSPGLLMRREILEQMKYRGEFQVAADFDFMSRAVLRWRFASLPVLLYDYRRHPGSETFAHYERSLIARCLVRIVTARRLRGRDERVQELRNLAREFERTSPPMDRVYRHFSRLCRREGFGALACLHAALAMRCKPSLHTGIVYGWSLCCALLREPKALPAALSGLMKGPFWLLLKREGFPAFPRY